MVSTYPVDTLNRPTVSGFELLPGMAIRASIPSALAIGSREAMPVDCYPVALPPRRAVPWA